MSNADVGLIGLGTMGAMLSLNIAENGFRIAVYNRTTRVMREFFGSAGELAANIVPCETIEDLVSEIKQPRAIILMVPAGDPVDQQISELSRHLDRSDLIVDAGNANFRDTNRRSDSARAGGIPFMGIGVSGGEEGARTVRQSWLVATRNPGNGCNRSSPPSPPGSTEPLARHIWAPTVPATS